MLLSMTGHGEAHFQREGFAVAVEVRTINNRHFKLSVRAGEASGSLEPRIENVVRKSIRRGTVQVNLRIDRESSAEDYRINEAVLTGYQRQLQSLYDQLVGRELIHLESLLNLPGVVNERMSDRTDQEAEWPLIEQALTEALNHLEVMRVDEGRAMAADLAANCQTIAAELEQIEKRAPLVVESYRKRLHERLTHWLSEFESTIDRADIAREVGMFADRCDISEEVVRLKSHLDQFGSIMRQPESNGRKLDFLTQELFRETNTIGSKANDAEIARHVIEIKTAIERMREMVQNVE